MIKHIKYNITIALYFVLVAVFLWLAITNTIQAFKCPKMSKTEFFFTYLSLLCVIGSIAMLWVIKIENKWSKPKILNIRTE